MQSLYQKLTVLQSLFSHHIFSFHPAGKSLHGMEKQLLLVANAHMHWDPEYSDVKLVQTMMFLSEVKSIVDKATRSLKLSSVSGETNAIPLVLCADLNSLPDSGKQDLIVIMRSFDLFTSGSRIGWHVYLEQNINSVV